MATTERESDRRRREEKWQTCWCCRDQQSDCRMVQASAEKLEHIGPGEKLASMPKPPLPKTKGTDPSVQSVRL